MRWIWILLVVLAGSLTGYLFTRFERGAPLVETPVTPLHVGRELTHSFEISDEGTGLESVRVWIESGEIVHELFQETYPGNLFLGGSQKAPQKVEVKILPQTLGLPDGQVKLKAEARDWSWRGNSTTVEVPVMIDTRPPRLSLRTGLTYARRGGTEAVVYGLAEEAREHGVQLGELVFPGFRHPKDPKLALTFYALPAGAPADQKPQLFATDLAGNRAVLSLPVEVIEREFPADDIALSKEFMELKVNEILGSHDGDALAAYLKINREMRVENDAKIREVCQKSSAEQLWVGAFRQLPNSNVGARFAENRTYTYEGRTVDQQVHLGYDLASTSHTPVPAANAGVVVFADRLGIYGNTIIVDHGLGIFSLYGHLSDFAVQTGQSVSANETLGSTGTTGLAGGDHLHYAMMVNGIFVDPLEWFDERWIKEHIEPKLTLPEEASS